MKRLPASAPARAWKRVLSFVTLCIATLGVLFSLNSAVALSPSVVISQIYGGGGNSGAQYQNDFIELFNRGSFAVSLNGWSVQYAATSGTSWQVTNLTNVSLQPGQYYLVQEAAGAGNGVPLPAPDASGGIPMGASNFKVALVSNQTALAVSNPIGNPALVDFVGAGTANAFEGSAAAPAPSNSTSIIRGTNGCLETDANSTDFSTIAPLPRNTATTFNPCPVDPTPPVVLSVSPADGAENVLISTKIVVTFDQPTTVIDDWFNITCSNGPDRAPSFGNVNVSGGPAVYTIQPTEYFELDTNCYFTIYNGFVYSQHETPLQMADELVTYFSMTPAAACLVTPTVTIPQIQGTGATAIPGGVYTATTRGIVVADFEGAAGMQGFYLQDPAGDGNDLSSDGILVFLGNSNDYVNLGDDVLVTGTVNEYFGESQIEFPTSVTVCGLDALPTPVPLTLPVPQAVGGVDFLERYEGMLVSIAQELTVSEVYQLGRYNTVMLGTGRLWQPTQIYHPASGEALSLVDQNMRSQIMLDDGKLLQNPDPVTFGRGGNPLAENNTLRGGDTVSGISGVLGYNWAGTGDGTASSRWRIRTTESPDFQPANPRPPVVARSTSLRVTGMNLLNFFNSTTGCILGILDPTPSTGDCRGANNATELNRQIAKTVAALIGTNADVIALSELENDGYGGSSAIQELVNLLNAAEGSTVWAFINPDANNGADSLGSDAIKVGIIYKPGVVTPVGITAVINSPAFVTAGDEELIGGATNSNRNRPSLAQSFQEIATGEVFTVVSSHLKSKGSECDADLLMPAGNQGNCNAVRTIAANMLMDWLAGDPTGVDDSDVLMLGDFNSYAMEDPIRAITDDNGYVDLADVEAGASAYSYVFDGRWGSLDYSLASPSLARQVALATTWHINSDEPVVFDYNTEFKSPGQLVSFYAPNQYRSSDHDPVLVDLDLLAEYTLTAAKDGTGTGTITSNPAGIDCGVTCSVELLEGDVITLTATADAFSSFVGWSGACTNETGDCVVTIGSDEVVTATFAIDTHDLTIVNVGEGETTPAAGTYTFDYGTVITVTATPADNWHLESWSDNCAVAGDDCVVTVDAAKTVTATFAIDTHDLTIVNVGEGETTPVAGTYTYNYGTVITVTATPADNWYFDDWSDACAVVGDDCVVTVDAAKTVTATFEINHYTITPDVVGNGSLVTDPVGPTFAHGTVVTVTAVADPGWFFSGWSSADCFTHPCVLVMDSNKTLTPIFDIYSYELTVVTDGTGTGSVSKNPPGTQYVHGTVVTLTANADPGSTFAGWSGAGCSGMGACVVTMDSAKSVTATFTRNIYTILTSVLGSGSGTYSIDPASGPYTHGMTVTLTALANPGSRFAGWSGDCSGTDACTFAITGNKNIAATFELEDNVLTIAKVGTGSGTVTTDPSGSGFAPGMVVTATAIADAGSHFVGWSGDCNGATCVLTMDSAKSITATFDLDEPQTPITHTLSVALAGNGSGLVTSDPTGIDCGEVCTLSVEEGTVVTLSVSISSGTLFGGWEGAACGNAPICPITVTASSLVTATFDLEIYEITIPEIAGGTIDVREVVSDVQSAAVSASYPYGTVLELTAVPDEGLTLTGWTGDLAVFGVQNPIQITVTGPLAIGATFGLMGEPEYPIFLPVVSSVGEEEEE